MVAPVSAGPLARLELRAADLDRRGFHILAARIRARLDLARRCSWCGSWVTPTDATRAENGAPETSGICPECTAEHFPELAE